MFLLPPRLDSFDSYFYWLFDFLTAPLTTDTTSRSISEWIFFAGLAETFGYFLSHSVGVSTFGKLEMSNQGIFPDTNLFSSSPGLLFFLLNILSNQNFAPPKVFSCDVPKIRLFLTPKRTDRECCIDKKLAKTSQDNFIFNTFHLINWGYTTMTTKNSLWTTGFTPRKKKKLSTDKINQERK